MHGLGNDFVIFDARREVLDLTADQARHVADRRRGIGCDQVIVIGPSAVASAQLRFWNADGSQAGACGNGTRCVAALLGGNVRLETAGGQLTVTKAGDGVSVDMGVPRFEWNAVPLAYPVDTLHLPMAWDELSDAVAVNVGNPHVVFFTDGPADLTRLGPVIASDPVFPDGVNVGVVDLAGQPAGRERLRLDVWERGAGFTGACGTGAVAAVAAAMRRGLVGARVTVAQQGGELTIERRGDGHFVMTGPAEIGFTGEIEL